jgi:hypothetical protein
MYFLTKRRYNANIRTEKFILHLYVTILNVEYQLLLQRYKNNLKISYIAYYYNFLGKNVTNIIALFKLNQLIVVEKKKV